MGYDGSGGYNRVHNWVNDKNAAIKIVASRFDAEMDDMASAFELCLLKDGQQNPTANLPMATKKHTGVAESSARTDYMDVAAYQDGKRVWAGSAVGTSAIALTLNPTITAYVTGMRVGFLAVGDNASAVTIDIDGVSAAAGVKGKNEDLVATDIVSGGAYWITYKGADGFQFGNPLEENPTFVTLTTTGLATLNSLTVTSAATFTSGVNVAFTSGHLNAAQGADIASATTTDIGAATGNYVNITGTTTITGLGTIQAGTKRTVNFNGILTLTHNATSLILPGGDDITTSADDVAEFTSLGSGNWVCTNYQLTRRVNLIAASVNLGASNQTGIVTATLTKVLFDTEVFDVGAKFDAVTNNRWTPGVVGYARISATVVYATTTDANPIDVLIYRNGSAIHRSQIVTGGASPANQGPTISALLAVNATTDFFEIFTQQSSGGNRDIAGGITRTWATFEMVNLK